jgi:hypothetical protein
MNLGAEVPFMRHVRSSVDMTHSSNYASAAIGASDFFLEREKANFK